MENTEMSESISPNTHPDRTVGSLRQFVVEHPIFTAIDDLERLRTFMEAHVFAVWDFMSLVKRLQRELTCVKLPWQPPQDRRAAQLINQIVLNEETDIGPSREPMSHLELYLAAMREVGASTTKFELFQSTVAVGYDLSIAFDRADVAPFIRDFTSYTLRVARRAPLLEVMASFFYGREDVISRMFDRFLQSWGLDPAEAPMFVYYLKRHIELDGDEHGPAAEAILGSAINGDPKRQARALTAACASIEARIRFWDGLLASLPGRQRVTSAA